MKKRKLKIKNQLIEKVKVEIDKLQEACDMAHELVQQGDLKSDGKYDTRSTQAAYLAGAKAKRLEELKLELSLIEGIPVKSFKKGNELAIGDLVEIKYNNCIRKYYLSSTAGGSMLKDDGEVVLVISVFSPIGSAALGLEVGDEFEVDIRGEERVYSIMAAY